MSLFVLSLVLFLFPILIQFFQKLTLPEESFDLDIFILDLHEELKTVEVYDVKRRTRNELILENGVTTISYRLADQRVVKSINNKGFVTLMYGVEIFELLEDKEHITLKIGGGNAYQTLTFKK